MGDEAYEKERAAKHHLQKLITTTPTTFGKVVDRGYMIPDHVRLLDDLVFKAAYDGNVRACVSMPPRHGKSYLLSYLAPAWYLMNNPDKRIMIVGYNATFAEDWGRKVRDLVDEYGKYLPTPIRPDPKNKSRNRWGIEGHRGEMYAVGVGGSLTGRGADLLLIDDPIKGIDDAANPRFLQRLWDWLGAVAFTRLEPDGSVILTMTRWSFDDPIGRIESEFSKDWEVVNIPAIAHEDDPMGREVGQPLWPERFDLERLNDIKEQIGEYQWNALYQGRPIPPSGKLFKREWFRYADFDEPKREITIEGEVISLDECIVFSSVDVAASLRATADYTVIMTLALTPDNKLVIFDILRRRIEPHEQPHIIESSYSKWQQSFILIEQTTYGMSLLSELRENYEIPTQGITPDKKKDLRALTAASAYNAGRIYHVDDETLFDFESELVTFPSGKYDDQVDALAYAVIGSRELVNKTSIFVPKGNLPNTAPQSGGALGSRDFWR